MTAFEDSVPLRNHRAEIARHLSGVVFPAGSVAAEIIEERLPGRYAGDPVRPSLVMWACAAGGGNLADAVPVAAAFDLFDRFLALHDELADESEAEIVARWGLGQSLNAGDALYALAFRSLAGDVSDARRRLETARLVGQAVLEAIAKRSDDPTRNAVLTAAALEAGAVIAGAPKRVVERFAEAGRLLNVEPIAAVDMLRGFTSRRDLAAFQEVSRYVARRAA